MITEFKKRLFHAHSFAPTTPPPERFCPDPATGLSDEQVEQRTNQGLINVSHTKTQKTTGEIVRSNIFTYFNMIFFVLAVILAYEGSFNNMMFLGVVLANTAIGIFQELRSKRTLDKLRLISEPETTVIRAGKTVRVSNEALVLDDIVVFSAGNQICADAVVCAGDAAVNEALVTGESDEIHKTAGDTLLSGSFVISGEMVARLDKIGDDAFAARLASDAKKIKKRQMPGMMRSLTFLIHAIGIILIPFAILTFRSQYVGLGLSKKVSVENTAAAVIGMIPEGLYLLTSIALAASTVRLAAKRTLVHDMKCIETLARVDVLCVDKTGTITEPQMEFCRILPLEETTALGMIEERLSDFVCAMSADNETMRALKKQFPGEKSEKVLSVLGFSSKTKYSAVQMDETTGYVLGAPEFILHDSPLPFQETLEACARSGERVLLFAKLTFTPHGEDDIFQGGALTRACPLALVTLVNHIRPNAEKTFRYFTEAGVQVKVISGDNPITVSAAAAAAGIPDADKSVDVSTLDLSGDITDLVHTHTVFGRVTPEQKRLLIRALKKGGHTVAMTGDGVNDVLALKDADCSIAMASGSDAASGVADLVLLDSDFSGMPQVVAEGRRVINNIERSASLFLVKNIFSFFMSLISILSVSLYPLKPAQISVASAFMIGIPSFLLALEPNEAPIRGKFLRNVLYRAFPAGLTTVIVVEWSLLFAAAFAIPPDKASCVAFFLYAFAAYLMLYRVCKPMTLWHGILFGTMGVAFLGAVWLIPDWFHLVPLDFGCTLLLVTLLILAVPVDRACTRVFGVLDKLWKKLVQKTNEYKQKFESWSTHADR